MLGWSISVRMAPSGTDCPDDSPADSDSLLARWMCDPSGLDWLRPLIEQGKVRQTKHHGYPNQYVGRAADILPLIQQGEAIRSRGLGVWVIGVDEGDEYAIPPSGAHGHVVIHEDRMARCPDDQWLTVDAWDQS